MTTSEVRLSRSGQQAAAAAWAAWDEEAGGLQNIFLRHGHLMVASDKVHHRKISAAMQMRRKIEKRRKRVPVMNCNKDQPPVVASGTPGLFLGTMCKGEDQGEFQRYEASPGSTAELC
jgi:hypothetical protein